MQKRDKGAVHKRADRGGGRLLRCPVCISARSVKADVSVRSLVVLAFLRLFCRRAAPDLGGLITLQSAVVPGQKLLLTSKQNQRDQECRVIGLRPGYVNRFAIAIAFPEALPDFWSGAE